MARRREREPCLSMAGRLARRAVYPHSGGVQGCWFAAPELTVALVLSLPQRSTQCRMHYCICHLTLLAFCNTGFGIEGSTITITLDSVRSVAICNTVKNMAVAYGTVGGSRESIRDKVALEIIDRVSNSVRYFTA